MTAQQAREITAANPIRVDVKVWLEHTIKEIKQAAESGRSKVKDPHLGTRSYMTGDQQDALWKALAQLGYKVDHKPDPHPGHPCSRPYVVVSW